MHHRITVSLAIAGIISLLILLFPVQQDVVSKTSIDKTNIHKYKEEKSKALHALQFWNQVRAYPNDDIPSSAYYEAFEKEEKANTGFYKTTNQNVWKPLGPYNVPGRMISLAVNPQNSNTLFAGSASGGLWRTFDSQDGTGWQRIHTGYPVLGVHAVTIHPADSNIIFIGTGEVYGYQTSIGGLAVRLTRGSYGIGILKSTDAGATWEKSLDWTVNQQRGVQAITFNPQNPNTIFAATSEGIYRSYDMGTSWQKVLDALMGQDIEIHLSDTSKIMVSCGNLGSTGSGVYRSFNGGSNWTKLIGLPSYTGKTLLDMTQSIPDRIYASVGDSESGKGLYMTPDFGSTWNIINSQDVPKYQGFFAHWVALHPTQTNKLVYAGVDIFYSQNSGYSLALNTQPHVDHHAFTRDPNNEDVLFIACDGGVYRSDNFGDTYKFISYGLLTSQFYNGFSNSYLDSSLSMGGLQDNNTVIYSGSDDWRTVIGGDGCWTAINTIDDNILYGEYQYNSLMRSQNRGATFSSIESGMVNYDPAAFVAPYVLSPSNPNIMYSGRTNVYRTTNGGDSWYNPYNKKVDDDYMLAMAIAHDDPNVVYVTTAPVYSSANAYRTTDGGLTWDDIGNDLPDRYIVDLAVDPNDKQTVYAAIGGYGTGHIGKTTDGGDSWVDITGSLPDVPTLAVAIDPLNSDHVYVGNDLGVYYSEDAGDSWHRMQEGLPEAVIAMDLAISPVNRTLRLATHGNGAYEIPLRFASQDAFIIASLNNFVSTILVESENNYGVSLQNIGLSDLSDSFTITLNISDGEGNVIFTSIINDCCIESKNTNYISFPDVFVPSDLGEYELKISFENFTNISVDEITRNFTVISAPAITKIDVKKEYRKYEEITSAILYARGDDEQSIVTLPFSFDYDGHVYDKIQISSNGWMEFGEGSNSTTYGLSSSSQLGAIGANQNGRLASTERPNKTLGPWWEDLDNDEFNGGGITVATLGEAPNRVFVIQWKNMKAYYTTTSTRVNFQVRLHETTNIIEYHYGKATKGEFFGSDIGAMIGLKDHIGGDYHYFDIAGMKSGLAREVETDLSPLSDWPGPDSCFVINTSPTVDVHDGESLPKSFALYQNYPNPFNPVTTIDFVLPKSGHVALSIFSANGELLDVIVNEELNSGSYSYNWNGSEYASGVYLYQLKTDTFREVKKMIILK